MNRCRGTSLVEMMVVVAIGSLITGIAVTLVGSLLRSEGVGRRHLADTRALDRLARVFRADVHAATSMTVPAPEADAAPAPLLVLTADDGKQIEYRQHERLVSRRVISEGRIERQESFRLPADHELRASTEPHDAPQWVTITLERIAQPQAPGFQVARRGWNVVAETGRQQRLAQVPPPRQPQEAKP